MEDSYGIARALTGAGPDLAIAARSMHQLERASHKIKAETKRKVLPLSLDLRGKSYS